MLNSTEVRRCASFAVAGIVAAVGLASPAAAATDSHEVSRRGDRELVAVAPLGEGPYRIKNVQTGRCLESDYTGHTYTAPCNNSSYQGWIWDKYPSDQGWWRIRNWQTDQCLDGNDAGRVYTLRCNGGKYQLWATPYGNDGHMRHYASFSGRLDGNYEGSVYLNPPNPSNYQRWELSWL